MRVKIFITGTVQGVGFRPFIYNLATHLGLKGYVLNDVTGVTIEAEGEKEKLEQLIVRIEKEKPPISKIYSMEYKFLEDKGYKSFEIKKSSESGEKRALILPDLATCNDCFNELENPEDRRYLYPFINCTNCGPRFTIIEKLPYDRKNTTMKIFKMCPECEREYNDPSNRRFHAQPNACPVCGPHITLTDNTGKIIAEKEEALIKTVELIKEGKILAVKGLGGFHLICDATNEKAVRELRIRKHREEKPLAVMFPDIDAIKKVAEVNKLEERALLSIEKPIVILKKKKNFNLAPSIAPDNTTIGAFLPYTPLHHLILKFLKKPIVATSANVTDDPIVKDNDEAVERLGEIADFLLIHNRPIKRRCDDSVVRIVAQKPAPIRRSRGFAPLPVKLPFKLKKPVLALGPFMKNTIAVGVDDKVFISQHIGDLETPLAVQFFEETIKDFLNLFEINPEVVVSDKHPGYYSTKYGEKHYKEKLLKVQHHFAHLLSCLAENEVAPEETVIGFAFDGTGYGDDGTIWGGEVFIVNYKSYRRVFYLKPFPLPGGEKAVKEPYRTAFSLCYTSNTPLPENLTKPQEIKFLEKMVERKINSPLTSSMGRLFDGICAIAGIRRKVSYHAQGAILLEQAALKSDTKKSYSFKIEGNVINWEPALKEIVQDIKKGLPVEIIARKFHNAVANMIVDTALLLRKTYGINSVALSGGVFQNGLLIETVLPELKDKGLKTYTHQIVPTNDGGISLGQVIAGGLA
ncbi:carbamoyltransferase HypF [Desulfurobacterium atlanticum]|uniref:Carbamoyltransferase n=1 Tax=Desulfurobacterium atlanticum TaxID=240169 RepID=A0A238Y7S4_9BACT|nr:carbamoyltransferase HypF [Desulfurobacterium atlanticum]SNR67060.1 Hydrogenase maturation protein, carbamoyltransferase HypF [Desulfurobacterium atlanticum]